VGRLFWKVFAFTLLAQLIATLGIVGAIWLMHAAEDKSPPQIDESPPANLMLEAGAATLQYGGMPALQKLLQSIDKHHPLYVIDDDDHDILGREVAPNLAVSARAVSKAPSDHQAVRQLTTQDGHRLLLFVPTPVAIEHGFEDMPLAPPHDDGRSSQGQRDQQAHGHGGPPHDHPPPEMRFLPFLPLVTAVIGSLIFTILIAWYFSKPIRHLRSAFAAVANGDFDIAIGQRVEARDDELADLGRDFDSMVERLRLLLDGQRRLLHDVSHELRSPLTRLQFAIGLARQQPERVSDTLDRIERESVRMEKLVAELLTLSKLEAGAFKPVIEDVSMHELVTEIARDAEFEAQASERKLELIVTKDAVIRGDAELLHRALENVVRNAVKQTAVATTVCMEVDIVEQGSKVRIVVHDRGPGVPESELNTIFKPFYRCDESEKNLDGHGLGLAIAQRVIFAHGGTIRALNRAGGGLTMEISLPL
jgi:two-component system OmpR family sensor kinase